MPDHDYLSASDAHLDPLVAAAYDDSLDDHFKPEVIRGAVSILAELAGDGPAVEFAVGTGRLALPLAETGVGVHGIDISEPMLERLQNKPGADLVNVVIGDMTSTLVCTDARLVYLVFNTIMNLRTQEHQVACFRNAAAHLSTGGRFLVETIVPELRQLPPGETIRPFEISSQHLGFDEYVDLVNQISISHHYFIDGDQVRTSSPAFRYVWPSELDLMAELAGLKLEARWANWDRDSFTGDSRSHVSVWQKR
ncbi:MAG TPA: class I SAM-dependent methyltransferase [Actinobacteria bacterium]|nr:class I SAM-dependent methyltransferase [Actinomycetota bacterium]